MKKPERTLESQYPARLLSVAAVLTVITLAWLGWNAFNSYHLTKAMRNHVVKVEELRGTILHLDEVLTMSARMAAVTNDLRWEIRYLEFAPQLDVAIAEAKRLSPEARLGEGAAQTDAANIQLVKMENQAFKLVRLGRLHEAQALLTSEAYEKQKRLYAQGLASFVGTLRAGANAALQTDQNKAFINIVVVLVVLPVLAVPWTVTLRTLNTWRDALSERNRLLTTQAVELTRAREEADRANQAKSEFLSRMSHELRTPLNAVLGFGQVLEMGTLTPAQQGQVKHILKGGRHLLDLINEVLDISRIEAGTLALSLEPYAVRDILLEATDLVRPMAADWKIRIDDGAIRQCRAFVVADHQRLKQVLLNLLSNAVKYNRHDGQIRLSCEERPEGRLRMCVQDTGPGIPAERMGRLFTLFDRLGAENSKIEGTGLGLALSARLMEAMNGSIGADSSVGVGTTFWIELPTTEPPSGAAMNEMIWNGARDPESRGQAARKILYIEDNLTNVSLMEAILEHRPDIELMTSMQGRLGLDLAREHPPHAIFLDLHLPDMSGLDVLSRLRAEPTTRKTPVVVFTADATPGLAERTLATGAHAFFTKPLDARKLVQIVEELLPAPHGQAPQAVP